tara:strand:+ start:34 stop:387 length:354 start_codon:yes stop_codon:yes gene_type:complete
MALGNANTTAQARGKNKSILVRRRKEVVIAKSYNTVTCGPKLTENTCRITRDNEVTETYFYDGSASAPEAGDIVYPKRRADSRNVLAAGHYKIGPYSGRYKNMEIGSNGVVSAITNC